MFKLQRQLQQARRGVLRTKHGLIQTPVFMPVATQGVLKNISTEEIKRLKYKIILANTYHLMLRPGANLIHKQGGLHSFMNWPASILTDSGGFQVFSLAQDRNKSGQSLVKLTEQGVIFKSYIDGSKYFLSPEKSIQIQAKLGVDIAVCLDECVHLPASKKYISASVEMTSRWARRSKQALQKIKTAKPLLFAVIQGGLDKELRQKSLEQLLEIGFDGYNIGGLSVGETNQEMYDILDYLTIAMPSNKPRYLMGVGYPENILEAVYRGIDMFDCVIPTREGRHGRLFIFQPQAKRFITHFLESKQKIKDNKKFYKTINIQNNSFLNDKQAINPDSVFPELRSLSKSYLHYLFKIKEPFGLRLASLNNLEFYAQLMEYIREGIK